MSIKSKPNLFVAAIHPGTVYYLADRAPTVALRPLTALDQMYAYYGSDLAA